MVDIRHRVGITTDPHRVYDALATSKGLAQWWTTDVEGDAAPGETLRFFFGGPDASASFEVVEQDPAGRVQWRCVGGPEDWVGTDVVFDIRTSGEETVLQFAHANWREPTEFMGHCSTKWAYFLLGLKSGLEGGTFTAYPDEVKISSWG